MKNKLYILLTVLTLLSCSKDNDNCECELLTYQKTIDYEDKFMHFEHDVMDTVTFSEPKNKEFYSNDCVDNNLTLENDYRKIELPQLLRVVYTREIVKCN